MKAGRKSPARICAQLLVRIANCLANSRRLRRLQRKGLQCPSSTYVDKSCVLTRPDNIAIGAHCYIGNAELYSLDKIKIGDRTIVGTGVFLCTGSHDIDSSDFRLETKPISIGSHVWLATRATVLPGVTIGDGAVIGTAAVVSRDVPAGAVVVGNPARVVRAGRVCPVDFDPLYLATMDWRTSFRNLIDSLSAVRKEPLR